MCVDALARTHSMVYQFHHYIVWLNEWCSYDGMSNHYVDYTNAIVLLGYMYHHASLRYHSHNNARRLVVNIVMYDPIIIMGSFTYRHHQRHCMMNEYVESTTYMS